MDGWMEGLVGSWVGLMDVVVVCFILFNVMSICGRDVY